MKIFSEETTGVCRTAKKNEANQSEFNFNLVISCQINSMHSFEKILNIFKHSIFYNVLKQAYDDTSSRLIIV